VPADKPTLSALARATGGSFHTAASEGELRAVFKDIGSQIGYTTTHRDVSWRFLAIGLLFALAAAGASMLWAGRLL
jgi:Ca-activated chloride channel family protein